MRPAVALLVFRSALGHKPSASKEILPTKFSGSATLAEQPQAGKDHLG
jgi:hypothetical protein